MSNLPAPADLSSDSILESTAASTILANILASGALDEIAPYADCEDEEGSVKRYLRSPNGGRAREGKLTRGMIVWFYPSGRHGPTETLEKGDPRGPAGTVLTHGLLVTAEYGADAEEAARRIVEAVPESGIAHLHIKA